ncbi:MAG TPA: shikimate dehydrogenase [Anaerolineae bacterium]|nr:shikimate dehydrogenase [Anaerolineae bacterium]HQI87614.1 shikimate dehydrogenase [Anaerolineae bacterium]
MALSGINGHTTLVGLIAWPVGHSVSPPMHNAAFEALGLNWCYVPLPVAPSQVENAVRGVAALGFRGVNVTVPHKQAVLPALDVIAPDAARFGAVNTIVIERDTDGRPVITGHNTDYQGFLGSLRQGGFEPAGKSAVVVGAGGAGRAVVFGLLQANARDVLVLDTQPRQVQSLLADLGGNGVPLRTAPLSTEILVESARAADLLVNATPVGMSPQIHASIWPDAASFPAHLTVFDLVYNPQETQLLRQARAAGALAIDGLDMLVRQGAIAFELWTGQQAPFDVMRAACERALGQR